MARPKVSRMSSLHKRDAYEHALQVFLTIVQVTILVYIAKVIVDLAVSLDDANKSIEQLRKENSILRKTTVGECAQIDEEHVLCKTKR